MRAIRLLSFPTCLLPLLLPVAASALEPGADDRARGDSTAPGCATPIAAGPPSPGLPDPFARADGTRIADRADWPCQRQALQATVEAHVYGPGAPDPERVVGRIGEDAIHVTVFRDGKQVAFEARLRRPDGPGPHPVMIVVGGVAGVDDALLAAEGIARIDLDVTAIGAETGTSRERRGAFFELYGEPQQRTGTLMAWAWGVSRLVDAIAADGGHLLRADAVAVTGCSRWGKGALAAGAFDPRIALTIPIESGSGGVPAWRADGAGGAQPPASAWGEQPWLGDGFHAWLADPEGLPIDQHSVLALVAPRGLLVLDNPHVDWLGARHGHLSALAAAEVYAALGASGNLGYHGDVADPRHCAWREEWTAPARACARCRRSPR